MGPFGSSIKVETFVSNGVPIISGQHLHRTRLVDKDYNFVAEDHADRLARANVRRGDVVFTHAGTVGQVSYIPADSRYERYVISQRQFYLRCNPSLAIPEFVTYYFKSPEGRHKLLANTSSTGVPSLAQPVTYLRRLEIPLPPLPEQRAIASILGALDDKIDLNRRMNETIEAMARAIFKSWFVDFDPVRAKMEGRQPVGIDAEIAALFPSRMVRSEVGEVPEGWGVRPIGDCVKVVGGSTPRTDEPSYWNGRHAWVRPKDLSGAASPVLLATELTITDAGLETISSGLLPAGSVLLSSRAPIGYLAVNAMPVAINQGFIGMRCDGPLPNAYVLFWVEQNMEEIKARAGGTTFPEISKAAFRPISCLVPDPRILEAFQELTSGVLDRVRSSLEESRTLASLRDLLLPRLLSGELRIRDVERTVEAVL